MKPWDWMLITMSISLSLAEHELVDQEAFFVSEELDDLGTYRIGKRQGSSRLLDLHAVFGWFAILRFGVSPSADPQNVLRKACDLATEFFTTSWWENHDCDIERMKRDPGNDALTWLEPLSLGLLFAGMHRYLRLSENGPRIGWLQNRVQFRSPRVWNNCISQCSTDADSQ